MFVRVKKNREYSYLQIVESRREGTSVKQRVLATLGQYDALAASGKIDDLARSFLKFTKSVQVIDAHREGSLQAHGTKSIGPALVFDRIWSELGIRDVIEEKLEGKRFRFSVERAIFLTVLHRLFDPGSDRSAEHWKSDYKIAGIEGLELHHLYRAMSWLGDSLIQQGNNPLTLRTRKDLIEEELFRRNRDLFSSLDLVFFDTTSLYFEGHGGENLGQYGHSKDSRPDLRQMIVGAILDGSGRPICCEIWPGNVTDVTTLIPIVERLKTRFAIASVCVVADRGMISSRTIEQLESEELHMDYILGVRMRMVKEVREEVLASEDAFTTVTGKRLKTTDPSPLKVREQWIENHRYIVCYNEEQAKKDAADRIAIVESLRDKLHDGDKSLVGNNGYRKYLKSGGDAHFTVDEEKIDAEKRFDGTWVVRTNTNLSAAEVALKYKQLWMVEDIFRSVKSLLETRPIYHHHDETIRGHVFCSFLALVVLKELEARLDERGKRYEWAMIRQDLKALQEVEVEMEGKAWYLRTDVHGICNDVFKAAGVAVPPAVRN
jgi:transposase